MPKHAGRQLNFIPPKPHGGTPRRWIHLEIRIPNQGYRFIKKLDICQVAAIVNSVSNTSSSKKTGTQRVIQQVDSESIHKECKAESIENITTFARCLKDESDQCRFTLIFKNGRLCKHPLVDKIVERTLKKG